MQPDIGILLLVSACSNLTCSGKQLPRLSPLSRRRVKASLAVKRGDVAPEIDHSVASRPDALDNTAASADWTVRIRTARVRRQTARTPRRRQFHRRIRRIV